MTYPIEFLAFPTGSNSYLDSPSSGMWVLGRTKGSRGNILELMTPPNYPHRIHDWEKERELPPGSNMYKTLCIF